MPIPIIGAVAGLVGKGIGAIGRGLKNAKAAKAASLAAGEKPKGFFGRLFGRKNKNADLGSESMNANMGNIKPNNLTEQLASDPDGGGGAAADPMAKIKPYLPMIGIGVGGLFVLKMLTSK